MKKNFNYFLIVALILTLSLLASCKKEIVLECYDCNLDKGNTRDNVHDCVELDGVARISCDNHIQYYESWGYKCSKTKSIK